jgi:hypothetical protein
VTLSGTNDTLFRTIGVESHSVSASGGPVSITAARATRCLSGGNGGHVRAHRECGLS